MGVRYNPKIITDGLVLALDAANVKSYPGSGTTWTDISGRGRNATLLNSPTFIDNAFSFDGVNDYVTIPTSSDWGFGLGDFAIDVWIYPTSYASSTNNPTILAINPYYSASPSGILLCLNSTGNLTLYTNTAYSSNVVAPLNRWTHCVFTRVSGVLNYYAQSVAGTTNNLSTFSITNSQTMSIGCDLFFNTDYFTGRIATVKIYSRGLSATEITQNFNALRGRYGI